MSKRQFMRTTLGLAAGLALSGAAFAQSFPNKTIRLVCPFPPAGAVDIASRAIAAELSKQLGVTVTVDNKPGAGGNIGGSEVARAAPDGYTILMTTSGIQAINPALYAKMPFDTSKDLVPISALVSLNNVLVVHPSVKANSVAEFIALGKPGPVLVASSGNGTSIHMSAEMFKHLTQFNMTHIPYKGSAPAVNDLLANQVDIMFDNLPSAISHVRAGKLRAIAVTTSKRSEQLPQVPTIAESGVPGYEATSWFGLFAPAATPAPVVGKLNAAIVKVLGQAEVKKKIVEQGGDPHPEKPEQFAAFIQAESIKWGKVVRDSGASLD